MFSLSSVLMDAPGPELMPSIWPFRLSCRGVHSVYSNEAEKSPTGR